MVKTSEILELNGQKNITVFVSLVSEDEQAHITAKIEELVDSEWLTTAGCNGCPALKSILNKEDGTPFEFLSTQVSGNTTQLRYTVGASKDIEYTISHTLN